MVSRVLTVLLALSVWVGCSDEKSEQAESSEERQAESSEERQAESSEERQAESSEERQAERAWVALDVWEKWDGFRGLRWGDSHDSIPPDKREHLGSAGEVVAYRTDEKMTIGDVPVLEISYWFLNDKFYHVMVSFKDEYRSDIKRALIARYGPMTRSYGLITGLSDTGSWEATATNGHAVELRLVIGGFILQDETIRIGAETGDDDS